MYCNKNLFVNKCILGLFTRKYHVYEDIIPWKDILTFSKYLINNVIYNNNGMIGYINTHLNDVKNYSN